MSIDKRHLCDFNINCDDSSDEIDCSDDRFYCESGSPLFVKSSQVRFSKSTANAYSFIMLNSIVAFFKTVKILVDIQVRNCAQQLSNPVFLLKLYIAQRLRSSDTMIVCLASRNICEAIRKTLPVIL